MKPVNDQEVIEMSPLESLSSGQLIVSAETKITINDFGDDFKKKADIALKSMENPLKTDDDFLKAEKDVDACKKTEDKIKAAWDELTKGDKELAEIKSTIDKYLTLFSASRLALNKAVTKRDKEKKDEITSSGVKKVADAVAISPARKHFQPNNSAIIAAIARKSKYSVMEKCVADVVVAELKRLADLESIYLTNTTAIDKAKLEYPTLFPDREALSIQPVDVIALTIDSRITAHKLAEKERLEREEVARKEKEEAEKKRIADEKAAVVEEVQPAVEPKKQVSFGWGPPSISKASEEEKIQDAEILIGTSRPPQDTWQPPPPPTFAAPTTMYTLTVLVSTANIERLVGQIEGVEGVLSVIVVE